MDVCVWRDLCHCSLPLQSMFIEQMEMYIQGLSLNELFSFLPPLLRAVAHVQFLSVFVTTWLKGKH